MTTDEKMKCNAIIHTASLSAAAVGFGLAQVPMSDSVPIAAIQNVMAVSLGKVFGINLTEGMAKAAVATGLATMSGRTLSQIVCGWIPLWGNTINAATAASITETIGWIMAEEFENEA